MSGEAGGSRAAAPGCCWRGVRCWDEEGDLCHQRPRCVPLGATAGVGPSVHGRMCGAGGDSGAGSFSSSGLWVHRTREGPALGLRVPRSGVQDPPVCLLGSFQRPDALARPAQTGAGTLMRRTPCDRPSASCALGRLARAAATPAYASHPRGLTWAPGSVPPPCPPHPVIASGRTGRSGLGGPEGGKRGGGTGRLRRDK